jgi:hypothetical protein
MVMREADTPNTELPKVFANIIFYRSWFSKLPGIDEKLN